MSGYCACCLTCSASALTIRCACAAVMNSELRMALDTSTVLCALPDLTHTRPAHNILPVSRRRACVSQ